MLRKITTLLCKNIETNLSKSRLLSTTFKLQDKETLATEKKETPKILVAKDNNITLIGINRPNKRNAINSAMATQLCEVFNDFEADDTSPVAVLYGIGGSFCSGFDILELNAEDQNQVSIDILMRPEGAVGPTRRHMKKPVVCAINGYCVANGLELALMCDLRVMEESAVLGFFNRRFGVPLIDGGTARLPAMIGLSRALDLVLTGRTVNADEALQMGLVNRCVATGQSLTKSIELAFSLSKFPQGALRHDRNSLYSAVYDTHNFSQAIQNEIMYTSKEIIDQMQEGIIWYNKNFRNNQNSWLKREKSMADWDDTEVAEKAAQVELKKQEDEKIRIEAALKEKEEKKKKKEEKPEKIEEKPEK